ncbi:hypothetical protein FACS1894219_09210 [Clostridia bacterium]|nr:hypothetical protein FACS1894219_09210 [Clostridia bacterium]
MSSIKAVILAAGKGTRLNSESAQIPKAMRTVCGKPLLHYVLNAIDFIDRRDVVVVVGFLKEQIIEAFPSLAYVEQKDLNGTGGAAACAGEFILSGDFTGDVLILCGDTPLLKRDTLQSLAETHRVKGNDCTVLTCEINENLELGRIIRGTDGSFDRILESKECPESLRYIHEYNTGVMIYNARKLYDKITSLDNKNKGKELYLTDVPKLFKEAGYKVGLFVTGDKK